MLFRTSWSSKIKRWILKRKVHLWVIVGLDGKRSTFLSRNTLEKVILRMGPKGTIIPISETFSWGNDRLIIRHLIRIGQSKSGHPTESSESGKKG
jgi:hypothetical protein